MKLTRREILKASLVGATGVLVGGRIPLELPADAASLDAFELLRRMVNDRRKLDLEKIALADIGDA